MRKTCTVVAASCISFLLLSFIFIVPIQAKSTFTPGKKMDLPSLKVWKSSENSFTIETSQLKVVVEQLSQAHYRVSCINQSGGGVAIKYDIINDGSEKVVLVDGVEALRLPVQQLSASQSEDLATLATSSYYWWDGIRFVPKSQYVNYPHPDRDYYKISPFSVWSAVGIKLYHYQWDRATSRGLAAGGPTLIGIALGGLLGTMITGTAYGTVVGAILGGAFGLVLTWATDYVWLDEYDCIWWWISQAFVKWLYYNWMNMYLVYAWLGPAAAMTYTMSVFRSNGYLRVGSATFYDAVGAGNP